MLETPDSRVEVASFLSGGGFSAYFLCKDYKDKDYQNAHMTNFLENLGKEYEGLYKCIFSRGLTQPLLTM
jgi:hypothetical protein